MSRKNSTDVFAGDPQAASIRDGAWPINCLSITSFTSCGCSFHYVHNTHNPVTWETGTTQILCTTRQNHQWLINYMKRGRLIEAKVCWNYSVQDDIVDGQQVTEHLMGQFLSIYGVASLYWRRCSCYLSARGLCQTTQFGSSHHLGKPTARMLARMGKDTLPLSGCSFHLSLRAQPTIAVDTRSPCIDLPGLLNSVSWYSFMEQLNAFLV